MVTPLVTTMSRTIAQRRIRRRVLSSGRWRDARELPYTEGQAVVGPGAIGPALVSRAAGSTPEA